MFANSYKQLLASADHVLNSSYEQPNAPNLAHLPTLNNIVYKLERNASETTVKLKSVNSPKFEVSYTLPPQYTVFMLKEKLITDKANYFDGCGDMSADNLKIVIKGKVANNCRLISDLASNELSVYINKSSECDKVPLASQVYWNQPQVAKNATSTLASTPPAKAAANEKLGMNDAFWRDIQRVCSKYLENSDEIITKFRAAAVDASGPVNSEIEMDLD